MNEHIEPVESLMHGIMRAVSSYVDGTAVPLGIMIEGVEVLNEDELVYLAQNLPYENPDLLPAAGGFVTEAVPVEIEEGPPFSILPKAA